MEKPLILIVDDQPDFLEIFSTKLRMSGYRVEIAQGGAEAISKAQRYHPALVLLDVEMPDMNGVDVLTDIRSYPETKDVKAIFVTNLGNTGTEALNQKIAAELGALDYIKKTENLDVIVEKIRAWLPTEPSVT